MLEVGLSPVGYMCVQCTEYVRCLFFIYVCTYPMHHPEYSVDVQYLHSTCTQRIGRSSLPKGQGQKVCNTTRKRAVWRRSAILQSAVSRAGLQETAAVARAEVRWWWRGKEGAGLLHDAERSCSIRRGLTRRLFVWTCQPESRRVG